MTTKRGVPATKRSFFAVLTALSLLLSGCASMLEKEYIQVTPHNSTLPDSSDPSVLRVDTYQELVNALIYFISVGTETGSIRLYWDSNQVAVDLENACLEVIQEDPLGAYAVEFIKYSVESLVTYSEAEVQITYRRTRDQVSSIVSATGTPAIRSELEEALRSFSEECVLRISYFDQDEENIHRLVREAYLASPLYALDFPEATTFIYPGSGRQRIVEILLDYHLEKSQLQERQAALKNRSHELARELRTETPTDLLAQAAAQTLAALCQYKPGGGSTAYHALIEYEADSEGLALAQLLLCDTLSVPCYLVSGTYNGEPHYWNIIKTEAGWRHVDLSQSAEERFFYSDPEWETLGYLWSHNSLPACVENPEEISS